MTLDLGVVFFLRKFCTIIISHAGNYERKERSAAILRAIYVTFLSQDVTYFNFWVKHDFIWEYIFSVYIHCDYFVEIFVRVTIAHKASSRRCDMSSLPNKIFKNILIRIF